MNCEPYEPVNPCDDPGPLEKIPFGLMSIEATNIMNDNICAINCVLFPPTSVEANPDDAGEVLPGDPPAPVSLFDNDANPEGTPFSVTDFDGNDPSAGPFTTADGIVIDIDPTTGVGTKEAPAGTPAGTYSYTYTITDGEGDATTAECVIVVLPTTLEANPDDAGEVTPGSPPAPVSLFDNDNNPEGSAFSVTDFDGNNPANGPFTTGDGIIIDIDPATGIGTKEAPAGTAAGTYTYTYKIVDAEGDVSTSTCVIVVLPTSLEATPDGPETGDVGATISVNLLANDNDPEGTPIQITHVDGQDITAGPITKANGLTVTLNAAGDGVDVVGTTHGTFTCTYDTLDGNGDTASSTFEVILLKKKSVMTDWGATASLSGSETVDGVTVSWVNTDFDGSAPSVTGHNGSGRYIIRQTEDPDLPAILDVTFSPPVCAIEFTVDDIDENAPGAGPQFVDQVSVSVGGAAVTATDTSTGSAGPPVITGSPGPNPVATAASGANQGAANNQVTFTAGDPTGASGATISSMQIILTNAGSVDTTHGVGVQLGCFWAA